MLGDTTSDPRIKQVYGGGHTNERKDSQSVAWLVTKPLGVIRATTLTVLHTAITLYSIKGHFLVSYHLKGLMTTIALKIRKR